MTPWRTDADSPISASRLRPVTETTGTVTDWQDAEGYGEITATDGASYFFHCTALADGTRQTELGATYSFTPVPGRLGRFEASNMVAER